MSFLYAGSGNPKHLSYSLIQGTIFNLLSDKSTTSLQNSLLSSLYAPYVTCESTPIFCDSGAAIGSIHPKYDGFTARVSNGTARNVPIAPSPSLVTIDAVSANSIGFI